MTDTPDKITIYERDLVTVEIEHYYDGPLAGTALYKGVLYHFELSEDADYFDDNWKYELTPLGTEKNWLTEAAEKADERLRSFPPESIGPAGRRLLELDDT